MTAIAELGRLLERGDLELPTLSDDEVAALSPLVPAESRLVPLVTHAGLSDDKRLQRLLDGEQSLLDRGLLLAEGTETAQRSAELRSILAVRATPLSVTIVDLVRDGAVSSCYAYGLGDPAFVLTETVNAGEHVFAIRTPESTAAALAAEIDSDGFATVDGPPLVKTTASTSPGWQEMERAAAASTLSVQLYAVYRTADDELLELNSSAIVAPEGVWVVGGEVDLTTGGGSVSARTVSRSGLAAVLRSFLALEDLRRVDEPPTPG